MIEARLAVEKGSLRDQSEHWGEYRFLSLPSPGDRVMVERDGTMQYLTVICVHHAPVPLTETAPPGAQVVAKWTGAA